MCISRSVVVFAIIFIFLIAFFFFAYKSQDQTLEIAVWTPITLCCIFYLFVLWVSYYFLSMGIRWIRHMKNEGYKINEKFQIVQFTIVFIITLIGMLDFTIIQLVNQIAPGIDCSLWINVFISLTISSCYICYPFVQAMFLL